ncbi:MAG: hypothetical protein DRG78_04590 [Epsilonproteobacteria bacterium]|nr:MAG: hypothetical protein DRG78_04590 [Campylobacterota bacterium]
MPEINSFLNASFVGVKDEAEQIAKQFFDMGVKNVLIKGGHSLDKNEATDYLVLDSFEVHSFTTPRVNTSHTHGTGCLLSSAIATNLAKEESLKNSVALAKEFLYERLKLSSSLKFNYVDENVVRKEPLI